MYHVNKMLDYLVCELYVDLCTVGTIWNNYKYNKICCRFTQYNCPVDGLRQHNCAFLFTIYNLISMDNLSISHTNNGYRLTILSNISLINSSVDFIHLNKLREAYSLWKMVYLFKQANLRYMLIINLMKDQPLGPKS